MTTGMPSATPHPYAPRPYVLSDTGPDGQPQVMLVTPTPETVLDRCTALALISDLLAALASTPCTPCPPAPRATD